MNCIAVIAPKKKIVGIANACTDNQRTVKIGYVRASADFLVVMKIKTIFEKCLRGKAFLKFWRNSDFLKF